MERILGDQDYWPNWGLTMTQQGKTGFWFQWQVINWSSALKDVKKEVQHLVSFPPMLPFWGRERINIHQIKTKTAIHQLQGRGSFSCQPWSQHLLRYFTRWGMFTHRREWESVRGTTGEKSEKENTKSGRGRQGLAWCFPGAIKKDQTQESWNSRDVLLPSTGNLE